MSKIKVTHRGIDYATLTIDGVEFEVTLGLADAIEKALSDE